MHATVTSTICLFACFAMWAALGVIAAKHLTVDSFGNAIPSAGYGWCFDLIVASFVFSLVSIGVLWYVKRNLQNLRSRDAYGEFGAANAPFRQNESRDDSEAERLYN